MNHSLKFITILGGLTAIVVGVGAAIYSNMDNQQKNIQNQLDDSQTERSRLQGDINKLQAENQSRQDKYQQDIKDLQERLAQKDNELQQKNREINRLTAETAKKNEDLKTVGTCLSGVVRVMDDLSQDNQTGAVVELASVAESCRKSDQIVGEIQR